MQRAVLAVALVVSGCASLGSELSLSVPIDLVVQRLQAALPACAQNGLIEAHRRDSGWYLEVPLELAKAGGRRTEIHVKYTRVSSSQVSVAVIDELPRLLLPNKRVFLEDKSAVWARFVEGIASGQSQLPCPPAQ